MTALTTGGSPQMVAPCERLSLAHNFGWMLRGNLVYAACQWGMIVALAKIGSPAMLGRFSLASAVATPVFMFSNLQLRAAQATDAKSEYSFAEYLGLRFLTILGALIAIYAISSHQDLRETSLVILAVGVVKAVDSVSDMCHGLLQRHERMDRIAKSLMLKGFIGSSTLVAGVYWTGGIFWGTMGLFIASVVVLIFYDLRSVAVVLGPYTVGQASLAGFRTFVPALQALRATGGLIRLAWLTLPLGLVMALVSLNVNLPRYFIAHSLGERELGFFAAMTYVIAGASTVIDALGQAASPQLANYYARRELSAFRQVALRLVTFGALVGACGVGLAWVAGREVLGIIYSGEYAARADVFLWLTLAATIQYIGTFLGYSMTAARYFRAQIPLFLVTTGITALGCLLFIPRYGLRGAAMALLISAVLQCVGSAAILVHACASRATREPLPVNG
ncbi:MAG: lipopolysaccharide biosynthesis protein [Bryobacteraceae bacterium]